VCGLGIEPRKHLLPDADEFGISRGNTDRRGSASGGPVRRGLRPQHAQTLPAREPGDLVAGRRGDATAVGVGKAERPWPAMNGGEKSDHAMVAYRL
jgi:hypothetical protein